MLSKTQKQAPPPHQPKKPPRRPAQSQSSVCEVQIKYGLGFNKCHSEGDNAISHPRKEATVDLIGQSFQLHLIYPT